MPVSITITDGGLGVVLIAEGKFFFEDVLQANDWNPFGHLLICPILPASSLLLFYF